MWMSKEMKNYVLFELALSYLTTIAIGGGIDARAFSFTPLLLRQAFVLWQFEKKRTLERLQILEAEQARETRRRTNRVRDLKRKLRNDKEGFTGKRRKTRLDWRIGMENCTRDYLGENPTFDDLTFQRMFCVCKSVALKLIKAAEAGRPDVFDTKADVCGKKIPAYLKVLNVLKCVRFGVSYCAFQDYFQIGEETVRVAFHAFFDAITRDAELRSTFFSVMTREDAETASARHYERHGIKGHIMSLDCCNFPWKNCPRAWAGAYKGAKKDMPTIVLEAASDIDGYFWHAAFGFPGTQNDIIVWDQSPLLKQFESGFFAINVDPMSPYRIGSSTFDFYWILVDGIYPTLSRFVKTISFGSSRAEERFIKWQESMRKDIERAFGILQTKIRWLTRPIELWDKDDIERAVIGMIIIHNMMVRYRQSLGEREDFLDYLITEADRKQLSNEINYEAVDECILDELGISIENDNGSSCAPRNEEGAFPGKIVDLVKKLEIVNELYNPEQIKKLNDAGTSKKLREAIVEQLDMLASTR